MSACFAIGKGCGANMFFEVTNPMFKELPAVLLVTIGGFIVNAVYCFSQNSKNKTGSPAKPCGNTKTANAPRLQCFWQSRDASRVSLCYTLSA